MKRCILTVSMAFFAMMVSVPSLAAPTSKKDQLSYAIGVQTAKAFKAHNVNINPSAFYQGVKDVLADKKLQMTDEQIAASLASFRQQSMKKLQGEMKKAASANAKVGTAFLTSNKSKPGVKTTATGLQYKIINEGTGKPPSKYDMVTVNYEGRLLNGKVFDSSYQRGKPSTFPVRAVIEGWQEALTMMKPGATWMLYIPPKLAYGKDGAGAVIGPNETLVFKVNLISVKK